MGDAGLTAADYATIIAGVLAALGLFDYARSVWGRTVGRRRVVAQRLARLGTGAQLGFFESVLGEPPALRRRFELDEKDWGAVADDDSEPPLVTRSYVESFFIDPLYYVQTVSDVDDPVVGFSITTRPRRFHPTITIPRSPS